MPSDGIHARILHVIDARAEAGIHARLDAFIPDYSGDGTCSQTNVSKSCFAIEFCANLQPFSTSLSERFLACRDAYLALHDGAVIGIIMGDSTPTNIHIFGFCVGLRYRGTGVGGRLMASMLRLADETGRTASLHVITKGVDELYDARLRSQSTKLVNIYRRYGFQIERTSQHVLFLRRV
jgi:GNAT superfamily N-acetyltransferase